ncbi:MAG TPA: molybdopterin-binding protein, partial [Polyangiales bacterium]|nr:molybdopterin-binding protein [Polyangiales bacterium]
MPGIDDSRPFIAVQLAILTISDTRTQADDSSGQLLVDRATSAGHRVIARSIIRDERVAIEAALRAHISDPQIDV